jgi:hypothetical protein
MIVYPIVLLQQAFFQEGQTSINTPIWVPIAILVLMVLLFLWGITRGNVKDENLPNADDIEEH